MPVIKYKGIFDYEKFFNVMKEWYTSHNFELQEEKFKHGVPNAKGYKHEVTWNGTLIVNAYVMYQLKSDFVFWDMKEVEVVRDGKKKKMLFAKAKITLSYELTKDVYGTFKTGKKFHKALGNFFNKYVYKQDLGVVYEDQLYYWVYNLHKVIKDFFDMETKHNAY